MIAPVRLPSSADERDALSAWPLTSPTFTVEAELGKGSFGVCFAATRCSPFEAPCRVALKAVPRQELAHHSREVETLLALRQAAQHPQVGRAPQRGLGRSYGSARCFRPISTSTSSGRGSSSSSSRPS